MRSIKQIALALAVFALPLAAQAQSGFDNLNDLVTGFGTVVSTATPIVIGIGLLGFLWGLAKYVFSAGDEEKKKEGRNIMIYGVIVLFVMISVWGLVAWIGDAVGIDADEEPEGIPTVTF